MAKIIFITGAARSGKSDFGLKLAHAIGRKVTFIATCGIRDDAEMKQRIRKHRLSRPRHWRTVEEQKDLTGAIKNASLNSAVIIVDCLTLWVSNLLGVGKEEKEILNLAAKTIGMTVKIKSSVIFITNELGWGIVPDNRLARDFRDITGRVNQIFAQYSDEAYLMAAGIAIKIK